MSTKQKKAKPVNVSVPLPVAIYARLVEKASEQRRSKANLARILIENGLRVEGK